MIPWFVVDVVGAIAEWLGYQTIVHAWHPGWSSKRRFYKRGGVFSIHFSRRPIGAKRRPKLKPWDGSAIGSWDGGHVQGGVVTEHHFHLGGENPPSTELRC